MPNHPDFNPPEFAVADEVTHMDPEDRMSEIHGEDWEDQIWG